MKSKNRNKPCPLCKASLTASSVDGFLLHPDSEICQVRVTDADGVSVDDRYVVEDGVVFELLPEGEVIAPEPELQLVDLLAQSQARQDLASVGFDVLIPESPYISCEWALEEIFKAAGLPRLGGASGDRGWSSISTFQRCPYLWKMKYVGVPRSRDGQPIDRSPKPEALEIGTLVHTFLAIVLAKQIDPTYPLMPEPLRDQLLSALVTPEFVHEAWRIVTAYWANYRHDKWRPLAVEQHVVDPKTGESCRIDAVMYLDEPEPGCPVGAYLWDHKTAAKFDYATLNAWKNDGEIIGLVDLWDRLKMNKRFGELQGVCVNILGKQQKIQFHRTWVFPDRALILDHRKSLRIWGSMIDYAKATGNFPRARNGCRVGFGALCDFHNHCAFDEMSEGDGMLAVG